MLSSARFRRLAVQVTVVSLATAAPVALAAAAAQAAPGDPGTPTLSLVTSTSPRTITAANQTITYTFTVQNNGPVTVDELTVDSTFTAPAGPMSIVSCDTGTLAAGESTTCTGTYLSTQDDVDAGTVESSAVANADDPQGDPVDSNASTATVPADQRPSLSLIESADPLSVHAQGDTVDYTFTIENTGNVTVRDVSVDDSPAPPAGPAPDVTCPTAPLAPGQRADCTASYTVTQPDIDHGTIGGSAVADADSPAGPVQSAASSATVTVTQDDGLTLEQTADPMTLSAAGQTVAYTFDVTNSGNVTVSGLSLDDTLTAPAGPALAIDCPTAVLAPGEDTRCTATYRSTQADVDHGRIDNVATATGRSPGGDPVASAGTATTVTIARTNGLDLVESSSTATVTTVGRVVTYSFLVTNTGNTTIGDLTVTDVFAPPAGPASTPSCPQISLLPGRSTTCTADYAVSRADLDNGTIDNTATAHGRAPDDTVVDSSPSTAAITALQRPGLDLEVTATVDDRDHDGSHDLGDRITWTIVVTNSGNVTLIDVAVGDLAPGAVSCPSTAVPAATSMTCTHTHAITQADVDRGHVDDTANAAGSDPGRRPIAAAPAGVSTPIDSTDGLQVLQTASVSSVAVVGQHVSYTFLVTDTGTTTLTDVRLTDTLTSPARPALTLVCPSSATLVPGATLTCTADYKSTQADFDNGSITNRVSAAAAAPSGAPVTAEPSTAIVSTVQTPTLGLVKKASVSDLNGNGYADLDDTIRWTFVVTNTGTVTLDHVAVRDPMAHAVSCPTTPVIAGETVTCRAAALHLITQADVDAGTVDNTATAGARSPHTGNATITSDPSSTSTPIGARPSLLLVKTGALVDANNDGVVNPGDKILWAFLITNTGNVTLSDVRVDDPRGGRVTCRSGSLPPGLSTTCQADNAHLVTLADVDHGSWSNTAHAVGTPPGAPPIASAASTATVPLPERAALNLVDTARVGDTDGDGTNGAGDTVHWLFRVANTGNVTISDVRIVGRTAGSIHCSRTTLAPGTAMSCSSRRHTITRREAAQPRLTDAATATGRTPSGAAISSPLSSATVTLGSLFGDSGGGYGRGSSGNGGLPAGGDGTGGVAYTGATGLPVLLTGGAAAVLVGLLTMLSGIRRRTAAYPPRHRPEGTRT